jgi:acyl-CoA synthetase (NDP forming)
MATASTADFERIFHPRRLAIVGVSADGGYGFGSGILAACRAMGFDGEIYPVNPRGGTIDGLPISRSVDEIPGGLDFAVIAVPAPAVPDALEACLRKGAAGAEVVTAGFSELGTAEGRALEERIRAIASDGFRVLGPNCFGIYCPSSGVTLLPGPDLSRESGPVAFLAQSGGMAIDFANAGAWLGLRFSKVVSYGNGVDLREDELLRYLADDEETGVIAAYLEGVGDGGAFFDALKAAAARKPVVVLKGGTSEAGRRAAIGHTASMGGSRRIWSGVLRQAHAVEVGDLEELARACLAFAHLPPRQFTSISCVGGGGALAVAAGDAAEQHGIEIPALPETLRRRIEAVLPRPGSSAANPIDVANPFVPPDTLAAVLRLAAEDERIELQVLVSLLYHYKSQALTLGVGVGEIAPFEELAAATADVARETRKPIVVVLPNQKRGRRDIDVVEMLADARRAFLEHGLPVFDGIGEALRAIACVNQYSGWRRGR